MDLRSARERNVDIGGKKYAIASDDDYLEYIRSGFEPEMISLFRTLATGSETILDIGANIGCTALFFGTLAQTVYAFEPSPSTFDFLKKNVERSGSRNIFLENIGLGDENQESTITFSPANRSGGFVSDRTQASSDHTVETVTIRTLDDVVKSLNPGKVDFVKIDVEGFEGRVLQGGSHTLATQEPVVVLELNHWCLNAMQRTSIPDFFDFLRARFPILLAVDGNSYLDLHDENDSYIVMYHHILQMRFANLVAAFDSERLRDFYSKYQHGFQA